MGLLDDAIREHLDLKRSRGADPTEVERDERDALGPVRRAPETPPRDEALLDSEFAYDHEDHQGAWSGAPSEDASATAVEPDSANDPPGLEEGHFPESEPEPEQRPSRLARLFGKPDRPVHPDEDEIDEGELAPEELEPEPAGLRIPRADAPSPPRGAPPYSAEGRLGPAGGETVEYDIKDALRSERPGGSDDAPASAHSGTDEDVLEETPEFLQDTPDHDRLWFEQRPPRDFDFEG